jgi:DNA-binding ferritin-like protein
MPPDPAEQRQYLIDQISKCLRLAQAIGDSKTAEILRAMASDYQLKLDRMQRRQHENAPPQV